jgi:glucan phosphoethanolaminetransferase (alkaline phosphatase superfamily)
MNNDELNRLWMGKNTNPPSIEEIRARLTQMKNKKQTERLVLGVTMLLTAVAIVAVGIFFQPALLSTKIGIMITLAGIIFYPITHYCVIPHLKEFKEESSSSEYLGALLKLKDREKFFQTKVLGVYFMMLSTGLSLYLFEYIALMETFLAGLFSVLTIAWLGFNWFYLRPTIIKKNTAKLDETIEKVKAIHQQIDLFK